MHLRKHAHKCGAATESGAGGFAARGVRELDFAMCYLGGAQLDD